MEASNCFTPFRRESQVSVCSNASDLRLNWLFDPDRNDHLPIEEQLKFYSQRDMREVKIYKIAKRLWGTTFKRTRRIIAPPMPTKSSPTDTGALPGASRSITQLKTIPMIRAKEETGTEEEKEQHEEYYEWLRMRREFRENFDKMGDVDKWLLGKPDKTDVEKVVLTKVLREKYRKPVKEEPDEYLEPIRFEKPPQIKVQTPLAIRIIEEFLYDNRLRLLDLFESVDKKKVWTISSDELKEALHQANVPISNALVKDLITLLDTKQDDKLDYRELAKGMSLWKIEKRQTKKQTIEHVTEETLPTEFYELCGFETPEGLPLDTDEFSGLHPQSPVDVVIHEAEDRIVPMRNRKSTSVCSINLGHLSPPLREIQSKALMPSSSQEMVDKRYLPRESLKLNRVSKEREDGKRRAMRWCVSKAIDNHLLPSTLDYETKEMVAKFRDLKLKEFKQIVELCQTNNVVLSKELLARVLLYPGDESYGYIVKDLRQPGSDLMSKESIDNYLSSGTSQYDNSKYSKHSKNRRVFHSGMVYQPRKLVAPICTKMNLSTGKAIVHHKLNCWMTFEEYDALTQHLASRCRHHRKLDYNVFWPGHLLHVMMLNFPKTASSTDPLFQSITKEKLAYPGYNNNVTNWSTNDFGYRQEGILDPYKNKHI